MKIGSFVIGGLAGAAIVMMIQRNQMMSAVAASMGQSMKHKMGGMKEDMIGKALNMRFGGGFKRAADSDSDHREHSSESGGRGLGEIGRIASQDAEVTKEINAILEQNGQNRI